jgi:hypothetical protein
MKLLTLLSISSLLFLRVESLPRHKEVAKKAAEDAWAYYEETAMDANEGENKPMSVKERIAALNKASGQTNRNHEKAKAPVKRITQAATSQARTGSDGAGPSSRKASPERNPAPIHPKAATAQRNDAKSQPNSKSGLVAVNREGDEGFLFQKGREVAFAPVDFFIKEPRIHLTKFTYSY